MKVVILHNLVKPDAGADERDNLNQVAAITDVLTSLEIECTALPFNMDLLQMALQLNGESPDLVFNLVESVEGKGSLIHLAPTLLEHKGLKFTGAGTFATFCSSNKLVAKRMMQSVGIDTPRWCEKAGSTVVGRFIQKSVWEHASIGIEDHSVGIPVDLSISDEFFVEEYIDGREFNVSVICRGSGIEILPIAEIQFRDFPAEKPKIVGYKAKWDEESFEYKNTVRVFNSIDSPELTQKLKDITGELWIVFKLNGYARVDFRVDTDGRPWVLEVNSNPCLAPDGGFTAALNMAGISYASAIKLIMDDGLTAKR